MGATWRLNILAQYPHDANAYTQGLEFVGDELWESTGQYGASSLRRTDHQTGEVLALAALPDDLFGEGLAGDGNGFWQLTWYAGRALRWNDEPKRVGEAKYTGQGWGLCFDGEVLWRSDGSGVLHRHSPESFATLGSVAFADRSGPVRLLNELECVDGLIYANVYTQDEIVILDPASATLVARIDASELGNRVRQMAGSQRAEALNGIAYHAGRDSFFLTGKYWPLMFEVRFEPARHTETNE